MDTKELDRLCIELQQLGRVRDEKDADLEEAKKIYREAETNLLSILDSLDKSEYSGSFGKIKKSYRTYFKMQDKEKALSWLKERGEYENLVSVNANTFSAHVNAIVKEKRAQGDKIYLPPGVEDLTDDRAKIKFEGVKK